MTYSTSEARRQLLDEVAAAVDALAVALAAIGAAYEQLDEHSADTLEETLFRPIQAAYGRAQREADRARARLRASADAFFDVVGGAVPDVLAAMEAHAFALDRPKLMAALRRQAAYRP